MGLWSDLLQIGVNEAKGRLNTQYGTDHIQAQNEAGAYFTEAINLYDAGRMSAAQLAQAIKAASDRFVAFAVQFGSRGIAGANEISALAARIIAGLPGANPLPNIPSSPIPGTSPYVPPTTGNGFLPAPGSSFTEYLPYIVGGVALLYLAGKR